MLVTKQPVLRRFWYPVMPVADLEGGPKPFRLLDVDIVLWSPEPGVVAAIADRCCHRTAKLSRGYCEAGRVVCGYHGWQFDQRGFVVLIPQAPAEAEIPGALRVAAYHAAERYGYAWVALDDPIAPIPEFEEAALSGFRKIDQFYDVWNCAGLRLMENSFDGAHIAFVHAKTFGDSSSPRPPKFTLEKSDHGFLFHQEVEVVNRALQKEVLRMEENTTIRSAQANWYMPFIRKTQISYPTGLIHSIVTCATPIDDQRSQIIQFCFRNDTEADTSTEDVIRFDRAVVEEDRFILEGTDWDIPLQGRGIEMSMASDRPGLLMRDMLAELFEAHGEVDVTRHRLPAVNSAAG
jgi:phenylpropionate dioxygenase-like ring-hydroxylating dioxygenase large terminal subunit